MNDLDEVSFENHSEVSDVDELSDGSDELSEVDDEELFSDIIKEGGAKKPNVEQVEVINQDVEELDDGEDEDEEEEDEGYLKKFDKELRTNYLVDFHPEALSYNNLEIQTLSEVIRDPETDIIIDEFHKTIPFLTKYEKTRILGLRAKQIDNGSKPFINPTKFNLIDGYVIAQRELESKRLPFIIRRPLPNGGSEFWKLKDLQMIH
ncbi:MAG: DNA-directed RNA polymerase subunit omega [Candidatus Paceibacterota bacterium]